MGCLGRLLLLSPVALCSLFVSFSSQEIGYAACNGDSSGSAIVMVTSAYSPPTESPKRRRRLRDEDLLGAVITRYPSKEPTTSPTISPTHRPTTSPSTSPTTAEPTTSPSDSPTTSQPTKSPTESPTTAEPTALPSSLPSASLLPSSSPSETQVPSGAPTQSILISTLFVVIYTLSDAATAFDSSELENILEIYMLDQFQSEWPDAKIVQLNLLLEAMPNEDTNTAEAEGEAFMLSGQLICNHESCPSAELTNVLILYYLSNDIDQILMDPVLESVIDIDISATIIPGPKDVAEANQYETLPDDLFSIRAIIAVLTGAILCIGASILSIYVITCKKKNIDEIMSVLSDDDNIRCTESEETPKMRGNIKSIPAELSSIEDSLLATHTKSSDETQEVIRRMMGGSPAPLKHRIAV